MGRTTGGTIPAQIWADAMRVAHHNIPSHKLPGIEQPARSPEEAAMSSFFDDLANAFGGKPDDNGANQGNNNNNNNIYN